MDNKHKSILSDVELDKLIINGNYAPVITKAYFQLMKSGDVSAFLECLVWKVKLNKQLGLDTKDLVILYNHVYSNYS